MPPDTDDAVLDQPSATAEAPSTEGGAASTTDDKGGGTAAPEGSSPSNEAKAPKSALEAATAAMEKIRRKAEDATGKDGGEVESPSTKEGKTGEEASSTDDEPDPNEDLSAVDDDPEIKKRRAGRRIRQLKRAVAELGPKATGFDQIRQFVQASGMSQQEFSDHLVLGRLLKADPHQALEQLRGIVSRLEQVTGYQLPADLADRVDRGEISEELARELSVERSRRQHRDESLTAITEAETRRQHVETVQRTAHGIASAVRTWESGLRTSDPDFPKVEPFVQSEVHRLIQTEGVPSTPEQAVAQAKRAYQNVKDRLKSFVPDGQVREIRPKTGGTSGQTITAPKSSMDAAKAALAAMGRH